MKRKNAQVIGEVFRDFFADNPQLHQRILEIRVRRGWGELLGPMALNYTQNIYMRHGTLYVSLSSSVLRSELLLCRDRLIRSLNEYAGSDVVKDIVLR